MSTTAKTSVNPEADDMALVDLGTVELSTGAARLVSLELGPVVVLLSSDKTAELARLTEMVAQARALLTRRAGPS